MDENGIALRGLLVRHLVLPESVSGTDRVLEFLAEEISSDTYLNLMGQYRPCYRADENPPLDQPITSREFSRAHAWAENLGLHRLDTCLGREPGTASPGRSRCRAQIILEYSYQKRRYR
jgi:putative pyruvate formate lyase activating enzyme